MMLSNIVENGKPIGLADAGQDWHTDMSYSKTIAFANVLYALEDAAAQRQDARQYRVLQHACRVRRPARRAQEAAGRQDRPARLQQVLGHDAAARKAASGRRSPRRRRRPKPPVSHPIFLTHPITGRKVLYANPGYSMRINELPQKESDETLEFLFEHQLKPEYRYRHQWSEGDVLMWENFGTIHNAIADYGPDEHRLVKRCQVMATRFGL